jgi:2-keto-4-pentenoate hydratase
MTNSLNPVAEALLAARRTGQAANAEPFVSALANPDDAFAVQEIVAREMRGPQSAFPRHWKTGATGRDGIAPHAALPDEGIWASGHDARGWPFHHRLIEAEIALRLGRDVTAAEASTLDHDAALKLVDAMAVTIELVDFRWQQAAAAPALLKLADLQSHGALVVGAWQRFTTPDWASQRCTVRIGAAQAREFRGTHSVGNPALLVAPWLRHATRHGDTAPAGTIVTTGTWCGMLPAQAGDRVTVNFDGVGDAQVQL